MTADDAGTVPEGGSGPTRAVSATLTRSPWPERRRALYRRLGAWRRGYRTWRRSRPFWGGLLLILAGLELIAIPLMGVLDHGAIKLVIYIGIGGVFGVLIGALLIAAGLALWVNPAHRSFYGIAGIILGLASFPASNLGGFLLGMLLAIFGGALGFAWTVRRELGVPASTHPGTVLSPETSAAADSRAGTGTNEDGDVIREAEAVLAEADRAADTGADDIDTAPEADSEPSADSGAEAGTAEAGTAEAGTAEAGTAEAGTAEAGTAEASTAAGEGGGVEATSS